MAVRGQQLTGTYESVIIIYKVLLNHMAEQVAASHSNDTRHVTVLGQGRGCFEGKEHYRMLYDFLDGHLKQD